MGADLYFTKRFEKNKKFYEPLFEKWVKIRNGLTEGTEDYRLAQEKVSDYYEKMHQEGYFRDSYNQSSVLWQFKLSWWEDVIPMLQDGKLYPVKAQEFLDLLKSNEPVFEENLLNIEEIANAWKEQKESVRDYFREQYKVLRDFLEEAIKEGEPIECSL